MLPALVTEAIGWGVILAMGGAVVFAAWRQIKSLPLSVPQAFLFGFNYLMTRILWRGTVCGSLDLPPGQGAVIICNHRCPADPTFLYLATERLVHWMVAKEYCVLPVLSWFFDVTESIPVSRGGIDTKATKMAIRYVQNGGLVGMFPEGRINKSDDPLMPGRPGAVLIALRAQVPIVPMYIEGSPFDGTVFGCLIMPAKVRLTIGKPVDLSEYFDRASDRQVQREVTLRLLGEIAKLAGHPDFEPQLAGRRYREPESRWRGGEDR